MKCLVIKTKDGWVGATEDDHIVLEKTRKRAKSAKPGTWMKWEQVAQRDGVQHRKLFALFNLVRENSDVYDTTRKVLSALKLLTGHFDMAIDPVTGEVVKDLRSISFEDMEQGEFDKWYAEAVHGVVEHILPQMDEATAYDLMERIIEGWVVPPQR